MLVHVYYQKRARILRFKCRKTTIIANMLSYATQKSLGIMPALCRIIQLDTEPALCSKLLDPFFVTNLVSGKFCFWNPESWALKSRIQVPLTKNPKSGTWISKSTVWNPESKTFLDSLEWCKLCPYNSSNPTEKVYLSP